MLKRREVYLSVFLDARLYLRTDPCALILFTDKTI